MMISVSLHQSKFIFFLFFILIKTINTQPTYLLTTCSNSGSYTANSLYKSNLDSLISVFLTQSSNRGFYSYISGSSPTTTVYGTYLCRGDISSSTCETCITRATKNVFLECPVQKEAIIWYEECFFRYSNSPVYSILDLTGVRSTRSDTITYIYNFINTVQTRMDLLIREAYSSSSYFATETYHVDYFEEVYDLYGLVQCTPDLDQYDCYRCLKTAYNATQSCCYGNSYALVYYANCMLTYKAITLVSPPPPPPPPPPPERYYSGGDSPSSDDSFSFKIRGKWFRRVIAPVIAVVVMILAVCVCSLCCCCCKKKKTKENEREISLESSVATNIVHENRTVDDQSVAKTESHSPN